MKELQPLNENVLLDVTEDKSVQKTAAGIIIPDSAKEKPQFSKVVAICNIENPGIVVGDTVFYKQYSGTEFDFESGKFMIVPYADLLAKIVETEEI